MEPAIDAAAEGVLKRLMFEPDRSHHSPAIDADEGHLVVLPRRGPADVRRQIMIQYNITVSISQGHIIQFPTG